MEFCTQKINIYPNNNTTKKIFTPMIHFTIHIEKSVPQDRFLNYI